MDPPPFDRGYLWINLGRGVALASLRLSQPANHNKPTCWRPPGTPLSPPHRQQGREVLCRVQVPSDLACWISDRQTEARGRGGGTGTITNARAPSPGIWAHRKPLGAALRNPAIVSTAGEGAVLGAPLAGGGRQRHLKGTTWASDQTARLKKGNVKREGSYKKITSS